VKHPASCLAAVLWLSIASIRPATTSAPLYFAVTNVTDNSFVVSWLTADEEIGQVQLTDGGFYDDARGAVFSKTHYVIVGGLLASSEYWFDIVSGATRYDNAGAHWTVNTGAPVAPRSPDVISGWVRNSDGSEFVEAIVFAMIDRVQQGAPSAPLSALVTAKDGGFFSIDLAETRALADATRYFDYSISSDRYMNNSVTLEAVSANGTSLVTLDMADARLRAGDRGQAIVLNLGIESEGNEKPKGANLDPNRP
jgi:hypothetical protein